MVPTIIIKKRGYTIMAKRIVIALGGNALPYAASSLAKTGSNNNERIGLAAILDLAGTQTLTVKNTSTDANTHTNSTLNVVKLA